MAIKYQKYLETVKNKIIVPAQKRTLLLKRKRNNSPFVTLEPIFQGIVSFPRIVFYQLGAHHEPSSYAHALNDNDELCHLPLFNVNCDGKICIGNIYSVESLVTSFYTFPFTYCTDQYGDSMRKYVKSIFRSREEPHPEDSSLAWYDSSSYFKYDELVAFYKRFEPSQLELKF